jgi:hypothetical protein
MKRGVLVLALTIGTAGVISAFAFAPAPQASAPRAVQRVTPPAPPVAPSLPATVTIAAAPAPAVKKASVEARQAPVPLLMKARPPVAETAVAITDPAVPETPAKATDESGEAAAKAAIEADGYKGVRVQRKGVNGTWHARALRGTTEVLLTVDAQGYVAVD